MARKSSTTLPAHPRMFRAEVVQSAPLSPSMHRVTVAGDDLADFSWRGFDHWFRLFMQLPHQKGLDMPELAGAGWWPKYLAIPKAHRPHCSNYTVAGFRAAERELDIDFVVHRSPAGELEGGAAIWAANAAEGDRLALLDQGVLFDQPDDTTDVLLVADESGLPAVSGILASLPPSATGRVIQEVPTEGDRRVLDAPPGITVTWVVRADPHAVPGAGALDELKRLDAADPAAYAFVVGESTLATHGRRHLRHLGLPKERITFSGFWKH